MKICLVQNSATTFLLFRKHLALAFKALGFEVHVITPFENVSAVEALRRLGFELHELKLCRTGRNPFQELQTLKALRNHLNEIRPSIVFAAMLKPTLYVALAQLGLSFKYRQISLLEGLGFPLSDTRLSARLVRLFLFPLLRFAFSRSDHVFLVNEDNQQFFKSRGIVTEKTSVSLIAGIGVDLDDFSYREVSLRGPVQFLFVGRLLQSKGVFEFCEAAKILKNKYPGIVFNLLGGLDKSPEGISESRLKEILDDKAVNYLGEVSDVRPLLTKASVFVLPSYWEGMPRSIMEAMAIGRPIVSTTATGCRHTVSDGVNGILVPPGDAGALAQAMETFVLNRPLILEMGKKSREIAVQRFNVNEINQQIIETILPGHEQLKVAL